MLSIAALSTRVLADDAAPPAPVKVDLGPPPTDYGLKGVYYEDASKVQIKVLHSNYMTITYTLLYYCRRLLVTCVMLFSLRKGTP